MSATEMMVREQGGSRVMNKALALSLICFGLLVFSSGSSHAQDLPSVRQVSIGASGDLLFHTRVVAAARAHDFSPLFADIASTVSSVDLAFANLETPLSESRAPMRGDPPRLGAPPRMASELARCGFDVLSVANNHAWDQRDDGMVDTVEAVRAAGMAPVGAAPESANAPGPLVMERNGVRVAFLAFTTILQGHPGRRRPRIRIGQWDESVARRMLRELRSRVDVVVVSMHWGLAYRHANRFEQRRAAAFLVRHGADVVLGHGPHVLQPVERLNSSRGEALVAYSLGNLISNQGYHFRRGHRDRDVQRPLREPATRDGVFLAFDVRIDRDGTISFPRVDAIGLWTQNNYWRQEAEEGVTPDIRVVPLTRVPDAALREERRRAIEQALGIPLNLRDHPRRP